MLGCKPLDVVMDPIKQIEEQKESTPINIERYQHPVGMLIYFSHIRLDIAFAIRIVSQYMHSPCKEHMEVKNETRSIEGFTDAKRASSIDDQRSTSSYCIFVWGNLATWRSKKQIVVARSSAEAEFCVIAHDMWNYYGLNNFYEINVEEKMPMKMYCDNKVTINIYHTT
ncbi:hypothetical protein AAG906_018456 [Vitis piasezkii]